MRTESPTVGWMQDAACLRAPKADQVAQAIRSYCAKSPYARGKWSRNLLTLLSVDLEND